MRGYEKQIYDAVFNNNETVTYSVYLEYTDDEKDSVPKWIQMESNGSGGFHLGKPFKNLDHADQLKRRARGIQ
ncbi:hypothetical protein ABZ252_16975 [Streptomyces sp. NPDC006175]|uniref:hypothetical protein n=1 Tax=unclassified Streptomyces TaxID=2593676 RepID=UPI0033A357C9